MTTSINRRILLAAAMTGLCIASAHAHPPSLLSPHGMEGVAEEIALFRKSLSDAIAAKDVIALRKYYADGFTHIHTSAKQDGKDARIVSALSGDPVIENSSAENIVIRIYAGGWAAVATGVSPIRSSADGKTYAVHWTASYARNLDQWQLTSSQATRGKEMPL